MEKIGYVLSNDNGKVVLDVRRTGSCGDKCATCKSHCEVPAHRVILDNSLNAKKGDFVEVQMNPKSLIRSTFILYTIPLIGFVLGMVISSKYFITKGYENHELYTILVGFLSLAMTYVGIRFTFEKREREEVGSLEMKKIL
jgi:sigma-E factor negative regulatory protein RseC